MGYAENFFDQIVIDNHAQKGACGDRWVNRTKMARSNPDAYATCQHFELLLPIGPKKPLGEFPIAQRAIKKESRHGSVIVCPVKESFRKGNQHLAEIALRLHQFKHAAIAPAAFDAVGEHRPEEVFLGAEMTENECFVYAGSLSDLACTSAVKTLFGKQFHRDFEQLFLAVWRGKSHSKTSKYLLTLVAKSARRQRRSPGREDVLLLFAYHCGCDRSESGPPQRLSREVQEVRLYDQLAELTADEIEWYLRKRLRDRVRIKTVAGFIERQELKPATVHQELRVLRRMLNIAVKKKLLPANPCAGVEFPVPLKGLFRPHYVTWSEQRQIVAHAPEYLRNIVRIITETGLRIYKELMPIRREQLDLENAVLWIPDSKTPNGEADLPLTPLAVQAFRDQLRLSPLSLCLFPSDENPSGHQKSVKKVWRLTLKRAKLPYFRIYDLRSTYATRLSAGGVADEWVTQMLRQGDAKVFKKYSQMKLQMKREALIKLNRQASETDMSFDTPRVQ